MRDGNYSAPDVSSRPLIFQVLEVTMRDGNSSQAPLTFKFEKSVLEVTMRDGNYSVSYHIANSVIMF